MHDIAHEYTEERIESIIIKLNKLYKEAYKQSTIKVHKRIEKISNIVDETERLKQFQILEREKNIVRAIAEDMTNANQQAVAIINGERLNVFAENRNFTGWSIESEAEFSINWTLYNRDTVERIVKDNPELLPKLKIDIPLDLKWNSDKIREALTSGIIQGKSIPEIAKDFMIITDMNKNSSIRNARTAMTSAQSSGRIEGYKFAEKQGLSISKEWISTLDGKTRPEHRAEDGVEVNITEVFPNTGLMFPADPDGSSEQVYNCRCTMRSKLKGINYDSLRKNNITGEREPYQTYLQWKGEHDGK